MADVAKRMVASVVMGTGATTVYTVPAGATAILRNIHVACTVSGAVNFYLSISTSAGSVQAGHLYYSQLVPGNSAFDWSGFQVMAPGEYLSAMATGAASLVLTVSGVEAS